jgi:hypothetical protein
MPGMGMLAGMAIKSILVTETRAMALSDLFFVLMKKGARARAAKPKTEGAIT